MTTNQAKALVKKIKYANFSDAVNILKDFEYNKIERPKYYWMIKPKKI